jgi:predicted DNA binding CopG/RHH family protein
MFEPIKYNDERGRYPEIITVRVPVGLRDAVKHVAASEHVSMQELIRHAIGERVGRQAGNSLKSRALAFLAGA